MDLKFEPVSPLDYFASLVQSDEHFPLLEAAASLAQDEEPDLDVQHVLDDVERLLKKVNDGRKPALVRGKVIDAFINAGTSAFIKHQDAFLRGEVQGDLISLCDPEVRNAVQAAKDLAKRKIFNHSRRVELEIGAYAVIGTLLNTVCSAVYASLGDPAQMTYKDNRVMALIGENNFHPDVSNKAHNYKYLALMAVIDFISGMTDHFAFDEYQTLVQCQQ